MNKSSELICDGTITKKTEDIHSVERTAEPLRDPSSPPKVRIQSPTPTNEILKIEEGEEMRDAPKFIMIFNKYNKLNSRSSAKQLDNEKSKGNNGSKYTMIFNKDVTIRSKTQSLQEAHSKIDLHEDEGRKYDINLNHCRNQTSTDKTMRTFEPELSSVKLNDAEMLMTLYGRSNLFIPELTISSLQPDSDENPKNKEQSQVSDNKRKANDIGLRLYNSLTSLSKTKVIRQADTFLKNKIASLTSLETHPAREAPRKHVSTIQEKKLFGVRSLDLSESLSSSDSDLERSLNLQKWGYGADDKSSKFKRDLAETNGKSDENSRGDPLRQGDRDNSSRKQVQWKSEVDVIYFESHQAADGDRSGEILGRVMEPLREEWEQERTGFYAKMVPLQLGAHLNERWQSLLKI